MKNYSVLERPVLDHRRSLVVKVKFILQQIVDVVGAVQILIYYYLSSDIYFIIYLKVVTE